MVASCRGFEQRTNVGGHVVDVDARAGREVLAAEVAEVVSAGGWRVGREASRHLAAAQQISHLVARELGEPLAIEHGFQDQLGVIEAALALGREFLGLAVDFEFPISGPPGAEAIVDAVMLGEFFDAAREAVFDRVRG